MRNDLDRMQGAWSVLELEMEGQTISGGMLANARVEISGSRFSSIGMGSVYEGTLILDAVDLHARKLVFRGVGQAVVGGSESNARKIEEAVSKIVAEFPGGTKH